MRSGLSPRPQLIVLSGESADSFIGWLPPAGTATRPARCGTARARATRTQRCERQKTPPAAASFAKTGSGQTDLPRQAQDRQADRGFYVSFFSTSPGIKNITTRFRLISVSRQELRKHKGNAFKTEDYFLSRQHRRELELQVELGFKRNMPNVRFHIHA